MLNESAAVPGQEKLSIRGVPAAAPAPEKSSLLQEGILSIYIATSFIERLWSGEKVKLHLHGSSRAHNLDHEWWKRGDSSNFV